MNELGELLLKQSEELTDEQLEQIAGGLCTVTMAVLAGATLGAGAVVGVFGLALGAAGGAGLAIAAKCFK